MFELRPYQSAAIETLWQWFLRHPDGNPVMDCCVGSGKSLMIAATIQRALREYPQTRVIVVAHQKELIQQNLAKLHAIWPDADVGVFSAALGAKQLGRRITYGTIGSIYRHAHEMGSVQLILADECHLISSKATGMWRKFISDMRRLGNPGVRVIGWTGTPFRNGGIWLTAGDEALFTGIAARVTMKEMLDQGYLAPLVPAPVATRIDASNARTVAGDYSISDLAEVADRVEIVNAACDEIVHLAADRRRWLVFAVNIEHANNVNVALRQRGIVSAIVTGETPAKERAQLLLDYTSDRIRCLVSIGVLTTGFDQPDIDFIALLRPTKSPTLAIQMAGRGMRKADGKTDCVFADFTDTLELLGPIDSITGRNPGVRKGTGEAPYRLCDECGSRNPVAALECMDCGHLFPEPVRKLHRTNASNAAILSEQAAPKIAAYDVERVAYSRHVKIGSTDSLRVDYYSGLRCVASEWVCLEHPGFAGEKARTWWARRAPREYKPGSVQQALEWINGGYQLAQPSQVIVNETGRYPEIIRHVWEDTTHAPAPAAAAQTATA